MGLSKAEHSIAIPAGADECFEAIVDYETFPAWQNAVEEIEVLERDRKKLGERVRFVVDGKVRKIRYTVRYHYDRPKRIWWDFVDGEGIKHLDGEYLFEPQGEETLVTYRIEMDPGTGVPGPVARRVGKQLTQRANEDLADEVMRRKVASADTVERPAAATSASGATGRAREAAGAAIGVASDAAGVASSAARGALSIPGQVLSIPGRVIRRGRRLLP